MRTPILFTAPLFFMLLLGSQVFAQQIRSRSVGEPSWDRSLKVETTETKFDEELLPAYKISVYDADEKEISRFWKDLLKEKGGKVKTRGGVQGESVMFSEVNSEPIEVLTTFEPGADNSTHMYVAFIRDSVAINPDDHPDIHAKIMPVMQELSVDMNKEVVGHQIETHEETLENLRKEMENLQKENEKLRNSITKNKERIEKNLQEISKAEAELVGAESQLEVYTTKEEPSTSDMKTMDKLRKQIDRSKMKIAKDKQDVTEREAEIQQAEAALPLNEEEQERIKQRIQEQQEIVEKYREKKESVN